MTRDKFPIDIFLSGEGVLSFQNVCLILLQNDHTIKYVQINDISCVLETIVVDFTVIYIGIGIPIIEKLCQSCGKLIYMVLY